VAAKFVKPFVKSNKKDFIDAGAIAEAVERNNIRFVPIKTDDQLDVAMYHDQGQIPMKLINFEETVKVSLRIPIIRSWRGIRYCRQDSR
jgi:4-hydroxy-L-threonine phosphate dehydrogenase PdxA